MSTAPQAAAPGPQRLQALDGVRGVAIVAVVAFHTAVMATRGAGWAGQTNPPAGLMPVFAGKLGVDVFFVLSGFLVLRSWQDLRGRLGHRDAVSEFARRRARRILPAYWFSLLLLVPLRAPEWLTSFSGFENIVVFASLQQFLDVQLPHRLNVVTWSLTTEVHFYVLLPALAYLFVRFGWRKVLPLLVAGAVVWRVLNGGTGGEAEWIFGRVDGFAAGMVAATLYDDHRAGRHQALVAALRSRWAGMVLAVAFLAVAAPLGVMQLLPKPLAYQASLHAIVGLLIAAWLVRGACEGFPKVFSNRALRGLGDVSYSLYLWHWPILMEASARYGNSAQVLAGALGVTAVLTAITYAAFERPFMKTRRTASAPSTLAIPANDQRVGARR
jgi:peptidoglycan/LPS O-acetylase OafA/YrhL